MPATTKETLQIRPSQPETVDAFMAKFSHPLKDVAEELRHIILGTDKSVGEEIYWNAPSFFYTGKMKPFKPKEYKRFIVVFNFFKKDCVRLIFLRGAMVKDGSGILEGDYADGRRLALFHNMQEAKAKKKSLQAIVKQLVNLIKQQ